jgi:hypothetical protein
MQHKPAHGGVHLALIFGVECCGCGDRNHRREEVMISKKLQMFTAVAASILLGIGLATVPASAKTSSEYSQKASSKEKKAPKKTASKKTSKKTASKDQSKATTTGTGTTKDSGGGGGGGKY